MLALLLTLLAPPPPPEVPDPVGRVVAPHPGTRIEDHNAFVPGVGHEFRPCVVFGSGNGFRDGDRILSVGSRRMTCVSDYWFAWDHYRPGATVVVTVVRGGGPVELPFKPGTEAVAHEPGSH